MKNYFFDLKETIFSALHDSEKGSLSFRAEQSDFARFNHAKARQIGTVQQAHATFKLSLGQKQITSVFVCGTNPKEDAQNIVKQLPQMRESFEVLPEDPYCIQYEGEAVNSIEEEKEMAPMGLVVDDICRQSKDSDLVGFYAAGPQWVGYANSQGAFKWFGRSSMVFDYSLYAQGDKAVKTCIAGGEWDRSKWQKSFESQQKQLAYMRRPALNLKPGDYRVYLAPSAVAEILSLLCWGGFSKRAKEEKRSPLQYLYEEKKSFHEYVHLLENTASGIAPFFNAVGFDRPSHTTLVENGKPRELLTAPRSAQQYTCQPNGADADESPLTLHMAEGQLDNAQIVQQLDQGIYINNLWYLNYSDRLAGRITGMTRFGCFWVDKGELQSPIEVLRFDDSLYRMLGSELEGLTREAEVQISANTYGARSVESMKNPGALLREMKFTL